ncbi:hypothetical protein Cabys_4128 [Caldithrix abyssi DSM 13497]|uniref:Uncharacterized protein n=1 Tax=Caldithrix abyssi DSM 13497 TaxID=880073 RepID=A0A1J1CF25_CALAY|nr:hypothetical protein Cabys_4128 [Caldithrix abyssi DSM 13497]
MLIFYSIFRTRQKGHTLNKKAIPTQWTFCRSYVPLFNLNKKGLSFPLS